MFFFSFLSTTEYFCDCDLLYGGTLSIFFSRSYLIQLKMHTVYLEIFPDPTGPKRYPTSGVNQNTILINSHHVLSFENLQAFLSLILMFSSPEAIKT